MEIKNNKKGIGPVVASALLLVVAVVSIIGFQTWWNSYSTSMFSNVEIKSETSNVKIGIETLVGNSLYVQTGDTNITITSVKIDGNDCGINGSYSGMQEFNISSCINLSSTSKPEVVVLTNNNIYSKFIYYNKNIQNQVQEVLSVVGYNSTFGQFIGGSSFDLIQSLVTDNLNNIYVVGSSYTNITDDGLVTFNGTYSGNIEGFILKFDSSGNNLWNQWVGGTNTDSLYSIAIDSSNNVYVGGDSLTNITDDGLVTFNGNHSGGNEGFVLKFDSSGNNLWNQWIGGTAYEYINSIAIDSLNNVYVGGDSQSDITDDGLVTFNGTYSGSDEGFVLKFDSLGNNLWNQWIGDSSFNEIYSVAVDSLNNVYVGGYADLDIIDDGLVAFNGNHSGGDEGFVLKFDSLGNNLWNQWIGGSTWSYVNSVAVDNLNNVYIAGDTYDNIFDDGLVAFNGNHSGDDEGFVLKFDSSGNNLWNQWVGGTGTDIISTIVIDNSNNVYVGGFSASDITDDGLIGFNGTYGGSNLFIVKFDSSGNNLWNQWVITTNINYDNFLGIDSLNNIYVGDIVTGNITDGNLESFNGNYSGSTEGFILKYEIILG